MNKLLLSKTMNRFITFGTIVLVGYMIADLLIIKYRPLLLPTETPAAKVAKPFSYSELTKPSLASITNRNIFNSTGFIPEPLRDVTQPDNNTNKEEVPELSSLPLSLIGTLVHSNPDKSLASIEVKGKNTSASYSVGKEIEGMAKIEKVERQRVIFRNINNSRLEYIEMNQQGAKVSFNAPAKTAPTGKVSTNIMEVAPNTYEIKRDTLNKYLNDLPSVLMQARAVPNKNPTTGEVDGFRILDMQPNSIYEELRLQRMDVIKSVNGEPVTTAQKALELYQALRNSNNVKLTVERGGATSTSTFIIK